MCANLFFSPQPPPPSRALIELVHAPPQFLQVNRSRRCWSATLPSKHWGQCLFFAHCGRTKAQSGRGRGYLPMRE
jgi:hypothetical protein